MKVMIPIDSIDDIGIREVIDEEKANKVLDVLRQSAACETINWNKRYRENMLKIKSGDIFEVAEVVKNLMIRDKEKGLSTGEKKMLNNARQILISELVLVKNTTPQEIESIIKNNIGL
jgi:CarD family transcriptional regulator